MPVDVAMEGYNGWARPLDGQVQRHGYQLYNVNNLKLARFKEIFPAPAKSDSIDAHKILNNWGHIKRNGINLYLTPIIKYRK